MFGNVDGAKGAFSEYFIEVVGPSGYGFVGTHVPRLGIGAWIEIKDIKPGSP